MKSKRQRDDGLRKFARAARGRVRSVITRGISRTGQGQAPRARIAGPLRGSARREIEEAKGFAATLHGAVDAGTYPPPSVSPEPIAVVTFAVAADRFWKTVPVKKGKNQGKPRGTNEAQMIGKLCAWTPPGASVPLGQHSPADVTEDVLEAFTAHLRAAGACGVYRQQLYPVDQGPSTVGWRRRAIGLLPP